MYVWKHVDNYQEHMTKIINILYNKLHITLVMQNAIVIIVMYV